MLLLQGINDERAMPEKRRAHGLGIVRKHSGRLVEGDDILEYRRAAT
jgi:hypothetical protein